MQEVDVQDDMERGMEAHRYGGMDAQRYGGTQVRRYGRTEVWCSDGDMMSIHV